jgi:FAD/FMN-containing dehydrogenase
VCDDGVVLDTSLMCHVTVDPHKRVAYVGAGAKLADVDAATQRYGLAVPLGINSTTGVSGLTLGGGFGWLTRKYGMTIDNLLSAEVVTADGEIVHTSASERAELFWAIRGGGGNFGVVTQFEFGLHPVGPQITGGLVVFSMRDAQQVLRRYRTYVGSMPEDLNVWAVLRKAPPLPFLPRALHGEDILALAIFHCGDPREAERCVDEIRTFGGVEGDHVGEQPYTQWQQTFDPLLTSGARNYWKSHNFRDLSDDAIRCIVDFARQLPSPATEVFIGRLGGAAARVAPDATAYAHRDAQFVMNVHGRWDVPDDDARCIAWAREMFGASTPYASDGAYVNFMTAEEGDRIRAAYGSNFARLVEIKRQYDPDNVFHLNQNIKPSEQA